MNTIVMILLLLTGRHPEEKTRDYSEIPAIVQSQTRLWHDPGAVERADFNFGVGGRELAPQPPFTFLREDTSGTNPKVRVRDGRAREWVIKFGPEASPDVFASRLAWAVGYYAEPNYYVSEGEIHGVHDLRRAHGFIDLQGRFHGGRFQLRSEHPEFMKQVSWSWDRNPFVGTHQLQGLKILTMLLSCWDNKDLRDASKLGTNTSIFRDGEQYLFFVDDWGRSMGRWGRLRNSTWKATGYRDQTSDFVKRVKGDVVEFGYKGVHTSLMQDITTSDVRWLLSYLGRVTDEQIRDGLLSSGATAEEASLFGEALRRRICQLKSAVEDDRVFLEP